MLSGLWLLLPVLGFSSKPGALENFLIFSSLLLWLSHRFGTTFAAFCTGAYRDLVNLQRTRFLVVPAGIILLVFGFVFAPKALNPLDDWGKIQLLGTIFFLYNTYHFGVQHYGVLSIYRGRRGQDPRSKLKIYEKILCLSIGGVVVAFAQICHGAEVVNDSLLYRLIGRESLGSAFAIGKVAAPIVVLSMAGIFFIWEARDLNPSLPKILYVVAMSLPGLLAYFIEPLSFLILWGVQHWMVSVALAAHMAENDTSEVSKLSHWYRFWGWFSKNFWTTILALFSISILFTPLFEYSVHLKKFSSRPELLSFLEPFLANETFVQFFIGLSFATVFIHFCMDRAIFRFSNADVRKVSIPLLFKRAG